MKKKKKKKHETIFHLVFFFFFFLISMSFLGKKIGFRNEMNLVWFRRSFVAMEDLDEWDHEKRNNFPFSFFFFNFP